MRTFKQQRFAGLLSSKQLAAHIGHHRGNCWGKRHRLINNSPARTRDLRGMDLLSKSETQRVKRWMPYGGGI